MYSNVYGVYSMYAGRVYAGCAFAGWVYVRWRGVCWRVIRWLCTDCSIKENMIILLLERNGKNLGHSPTIENPNPNPKGVMPIKVSTSQIIILIGHRPELDDVKVFRKRDHVVVKVVVCAVKKEDVIPLLCLQYYMSHRNGARQHKFHKGRV